MDLRIERIVIGLGVSAWLAIVCFSGIRLLDYTASPGDSSAVPALWPASSGTPRSPERPTVVVFLHPRCPCSRSTLGNMERLVARHANHADWRIVLVHPDSAPADWADTSLARWARKIHGVRVVTDEGGREAALFSVKTSGHTLLYDAPGRLVFSGGITPARGHEGDCAGVLSIDRYLSTGGREVVDQPVFGCPLDNPDSPIAKRKEVRSECPS